MDMGQHESPSSSPHPGSLTPSRKRSRDFVMEEDLTCEKERRPNAMDLDGEDLPQYRWRSLNDLSPNELVIARSISAEKINTILFLDAVIPNDVTVTASIKPFGSFFGGGGSTSGGTPHAFNSSTSPSPFQFGQSSPLQIQRTQHMGGFRSAGLTGGLTPVMTTSPLPAIAAQSPAPPVFGGIFSVQPTTGGSARDLQALCRSNGVNLANLRIPKVVYMITKFIADTALHVPGVFYQQGEPAKVVFIQNKVGAIADIREMHNTFRPRDAVELAVVLQNYLKGLPPLLPEENQHIWKGIVGTNQAQDSALFLKGATVKEPSDTVVRLLRDALLLLPVANRHLLQYLVMFSSYFVRPTPAKSVGAVAAHLATVFGPLLTHDTSQGAPSYTPASVRMTPSGAINVRRANWAVSLFELLIYAHGFHYTQTLSIIKPEAIPLSPGLSLESPGVNASASGLGSSAPPFWERASRIFWINPSFDEEIQSIIAAARKATLKKEWPGRRTPVRFEEQKRIANSKKACARRLFGGAIKPVMVTPHMPTTTTCTTSLNFVATDHGKKGHATYIERNLDRERFCKRRRVEH
ncbi:hypothetical protein HK104_007401 [Borealophlyctis nickersoniae]|nr:hypothetical protein HK104_007401 [Borealophlyctis nickersoniae]